MTEAIRVQEDWSKHPYIRKAVKLKKKFARSGNHHGQHLAATAESVLEMAANDMLGLVDDAFDESDIAEYLIEEISATREDASICAAAEMYLASVEDDGYIAKTLAANLTSAMVDFANTTLDIAEQQELPEDISEAIEAIASAYKKGHYLIDEDGLEIPTDDIYKHTNSELAIALSALGCASLFALSEYITTLQPEEDTQMTDTETHQPIAALMHTDTRIAEKGTDLPDYESAIHYISVKSEELATSEGAQRKKSGEMWERMVVEFLRTDPVYRNRFAKVWLWEEYSDQPDIGIDIVAETFDGKLIAIQCKFSKDPERSLQKGAIDSFIATTDTKEWSGRYVFWSGFKVSPHIDRQIMEDRQVPLTMITGSVLRTTNTAWAELATTGKGSAKPLKKARGYQTEAISKVEDALETNDRTQLIMACGSGKTYTSQLAAEKIAGQGGTVLYIVPSIALMGQTMREWAEQEDIEGRGLKHSFLGVCSDSGAGKQVKEDGIGGMHKTDIAQLEMPVGTDAAEIAKMLNEPIPDGTMRTVFSTYQSLPKILEAQQKHGAPEFGLMFCDEAHRTTGMSAADDTSHFHLAHNDITADQRIYMTATPKVFSEGAQGKAKKQGKAIYTMGDTDIYGEEAFKLSFSEAIEQHVLADYKVHIIQVAESVSAAILNEFTSDPELDEIGKQSRNAMLKTDVAARLVGLWQALTGAEGVKTGTLWKNIVYLDTINNSKAFAGVFPIMCDYLSSISGLSLPPVRVKHVDGGMSATIRQQCLSWLDGANIHGEIRLLSNAKCLSEGVDVPSLDGVAFLVPKGSIVDIVQSVGRVIRAAPLKEYGHVVLPAVLPLEIKSGIDNHLKKDKHWQTTWQVLRALRSHDDIFANELAVMELHDGIWPERIVLSITDETTGLEGLCFAGGGDSNPQRSEGGTGSRSDAPGGEWQAEQETAGERLYGDPEDSNSAVATWLASGGKTASAAAFAGSGDVGVQTSMNFAEMLKAYPDEVLKMLQENIAVTTLEKVGDRQYWDSWGKDAAESYSHVLGRLENYRENNAEFAEEVSKTTAGLAATLGALGSEEKTLNILAQYIIVKPVFAALFGTAEHFDDSPLSVTMSSLAETVEILELENETAALEDFYKHVAEKARMVTSPQDKQALIKHLYEDFIHTVFPQEAKDFGVVYTPNEIVDFTLRSVDWAIKEHLGIEDGIADESVEVLDPFAGTGTFLVNLVQNRDLIPDDKLAHKFANNLHTNEVMALPYWATELNLEQAYMARTDGEYLPYENGVLADTFSMGQTQMAEQRAQQSLQYQTENENISRAESQDKQPITCIVGNPPWAVGKTGEWSELENRIAETYMEKADTQLKNSLRDSYILAMRWASDRIGNKGVVGFVTNNSWLSSNAGAGVRRTLEEEFDHIYVLNMRGKGGAATSAEQRAIEGENLFAVTVGNQVVVLVKTGEHSQEKATIVYADTIGLSAADKLSKITSTQHIGSQEGGMSWEQKESDYRGDWINQGHADWQHLITIGDKNTKAGKANSSIFQLYSRGLITGMGSHSMGSSQSDLLERGHMAATEYNDMISTGNIPPKITASGANWHREVVNKLKQQQSKTNTEDIEFATISESNVIKTMAAPWLPQYMLFHKTFNNCQYRISDIYDMTENMHKNLTISLASKGTQTGFRAIAHYLPADLSLTEKAMSFPRYRLAAKETFIEGEANGLMHGASASGDRVYIDNISDDFLVGFRDKYSDDNIVKDDIFFYIYGILHHPEYRNKYGNDLTKDLPRMPYAPDFWAFSNAGKELADIHANYDSLQGWRGDMNVEYSADFNGEDRACWYVEKAKWEDDGATLKLNDYITIRNIPAGAHTYKIAGKSPIQQFAYDTRRKVDKKTEIVNDINDLYNDNPSEVLLRARQLIEVGVRSSEIISALPEKFE